jgi:hypothetical protein
MRPWNFLRTKLNLGEIRYRGLGPPKKQGTGDGSPSLFALADTIGRLINSVEDGSYATLAQNNAC